MKPTRVEVVVPGGGQLLPDGIIWLYVSAPLAAAPLLVPNLLDMSWSEALWHIGAVSIPFLVLSLSFYALYRYVLPRFIWKLSSAPARGWTHAALATGVPLALSSMLYPIYLSTCGTQTPASWLGFTLECIIISWVMLMPALLVQRLKLRNQQVEQLALTQRQAALEAQLQALQARTNPHFFFNTINTVTALIPDDPLLAERTLEQLADVFRYALEASSTKRVPLSRELDMVKDYLAIQTARFGAKLKSSVSCEEGAGTIEVPPLLLQPLVENAILHGLQHRGGGEVHVSARREEDRVVIEVRDDGPGPGKSNHQGTQTSMRELKERLRLVYGERSAFALNAIPEGGCCARLAIPVGAAT